MKKTIAVIGLGRFGLDLVSELAKLDVEVIAIDSNKDKVKMASEYIQHAIICDSTSSAALKDAGVKNADHVIISFGQNDEKTIISTVQTTIMVKKLGVQKITVRLDSEEYAETLLEIGATKIIYPYKIASERCATRFVMDNINDYFNVAGNFNMFEVLIPEDFSERNLFSLNTPSNYGLNVLMVKRDNKVFTPASDSTLKANDAVFVFGTKAGVEKFSHFIKTQH